ncbi:YtpI family protein [Paenalkalicoccus suaedae]|uniref:YtpI family protein n=1 Tax=Paenalkalicoccus suaedae TaxID=2592382 RepID=A0A859FIJ0_9BACI|nr:YtpI family protein [Paenalkalicoccus suaedae]QKS72046.1 YtpI family protein [Paenalkalicoccus suaedae]
MLIFIIAIVSSLILFVYFKVQQARVQGPMEKKFYAAKGSMCFGLFMLAFGMNSYMGLGTQVALFVAIVFILMGGANIFFGWQRHKEVKPYALKEREA